jgi:hypothetical protein
MFYVPGWRDTVAWLGAGGMGIFGASNLWRRFGQHIWVPRGLYGHNHAGARASVALAIGAAVGGGSQQVSWGLGGRF